MRGGAGLCWGRAAAPPCQVTARRLSPRQRHVGVSVYATPFLIVPVFSVKEETRSSPESEGGNRGFRALTREEEE